VGGVSTDNGPDLVALSDRLAIEDLIYRYSDAVTRADWDQCEAVFAPDAIWESPELGLRYEGARQFRDFLAETTTFDLLIQTAHSPVIRLLGPTRAEATTTMHEFVRGRGLVDSPLGESGAEQNSEQYGVYFDDIVKLENEWKFARRLFTPMYVGAGVVTGQVLTPRSRLFRPE
jgi:hypothetical protein